MDTQQKVLCVPPFFFGAKIPSLSMPSLPRPFFVATTAVVCRIAREPALFGHPKHTVKSHKLHAEGKPQTKSLPSPRRQLHEKNSLVKPGRNPDLRPFVALFFCAAAPKKVSAALSPKVLGGVDINLSGTVARGHHAMLFDAVEAARKRNGAVSTPLKGAAKRPNIVVVVLESTTGTLATASNSHGVSPWLKELAAR